MKSLFGVNVTLPVNGSIVYLPTVFPVSSFAGISVASIGCLVTGSKNLAGCCSLIVIGATSSPCVNLGVPSCGCPCFPLEVTSSPVGLTGVTVGV